MKGLRQHFLTGLVVFLPLVLTLVIIHYVLKITDAWIVDPVYQTLPFTIDRTTVVFLIKILIVVLFFLFICLLGLVSERFIGKKLLEWGDGMLTKVPIISPIYATIKEVLHTLIGQKKDVFGNAVLIEYPRPGIYTIGFVTRASNPDLNRKLGKDLVSVFVPMPPNPTTGTLVFVPRDHVIELPMRTEEVIKLVVSLGTIGGAWTKEGGARGG